MSGEVTPRPAVLYPNLYVWYIFAASLDVMMTYAFIYKLGGIEMNRVADLLVDRFEHWGLIGLKFSTVILVVLICEIVGRRSFKTGRRLAVAAIIVSAFPVGYGIVALLAWMHFGGPGPTHTVPHP